MNEIYFQREIFEIKEEERTQENVISFLKNLILYGLKQDASDIHIEFLEKKVRVRVRIDGVLVVYQNIDKEFGIRLITKIKLMSELDIGEKRLPQDGRFKGKFLNNTVDFRVSFIPTIFGEKCVIRILRNDIKKLDIYKLGFSDENIDILKKIIQKKSGFLIICGPTGSGKTTTLYSLINLLNSETRNIVSIEDPIEYQLDGINQIQCKKEIGLDFSQILRGVLRQDPDVIFIGEIRDKETAEIALMASLTGHFVMSTLHTKNAISVLDRLFSFKLDRYILSEALTTIVSQRLVRKICIFCKGEGCNRCGNGFLGREVVEELLYIDDKIRFYILNDNIEGLKLYLKENGFKNLSERGYEKVDKGVTTKNEIIEECEL